MNKKMTKLQCALIAAGFISAATIAPLAYAQPEVGSDYYSVQLASAKSADALEKLYPMVAAQPHARVEQRGSDYALRVGFWKTRAEANENLATLGSNFKGAFVRVAAYRPESIVIAKEGTRMPADVPGAAPVKEAHSNGGSKSLLKMVAANTGARTSTDIRQIAYRADEAAEPVVVAQATTPAPKPATPAPADAPTLTKPEGSGITRGSVADQAGASDLAGARAQGAVGEPFSGAFAPAPGGGVRMGAFTLYPAVQVGLRHDDNIFLSDTNKRSSWISILSPFVRAETRSESGIYDLSYRADIANYWDSSADNYRDQFFAGNADWAFGSRMGLRLRAEHIRSHDPRGATDRPSGPEPDEWHSSGISGVFAYGARGAQGRLEAEAGYLDKKYDNNRATTIAADRDVAFAGATFFWRVMPRTSLLFQAKNAEIDYKNDIALLSSSERRFLAGVTWEATAKTTGIFKVGQLRKDFDSVARGDFTGLSWEGAVKWSPLTYSTFDIVTARETNESTGVGDFVLSKSLTGVWTHAWNSRTTTYVNLGFRNDEFRGAGAIRDDDTFSAGLRATYQMRRWLNLGAEYIYTDRSSNVPAGDYSRNVFMITLGATL